MRQLAVTLNPPDLPAYVRVIRVPACGTHRFRVCSKSAWGCWSHWAGNHTEACFCTVEEREANPPLHIHRWKGFLHVIAEGSGRHYFLEVTADALNNFLLRVPDRHNLRGMLINVRREPETKRGAIVIEIAAPAPKNPDVPPERSPRPMLERLWRTKLPTGPLAS